MERSQDEEKRMLVKDTITMYNNDVFRRAVQNEVRKREAQRLKRSLLYPRKVGLVRGK